MVPLSGKFSSFPPIESFVEQIIFRRMLLLLLLTRRTSKSHRPALFSTTIHYVSYAHPYLFELEHFGSLIADWKPLASSTELLCQELDTRLAVVETPEAFEGMMEDLNSCSEVAVDLEVRFIEQCDEHYVCSCTGHPLID